MKILKKGFYSLDMKRYYCFFAGFVGWQLYYTHWMLTITSKIKNDFKF